MHLPFSLHILWLSSNSQLPVHHPFECVLLSLWQWAQEAYILLFPHDTLESINNTIYISFYKNIRQYKVLHTWIFCKINTRFKILPHSVSSLRSPQSSTPSQIALLSIHWELPHVNPLLGQSTKTYIKLYECKLEDLLYCITNNKDQNIFII